jgi:hypothetical protein
MLAQIGAQALQAKPGRVTPYQEGEGGAWPAAISWAATEPPRKPVAPVNRMCSRESAAVKTSPWLIAFMVYLGG